MMDTLDVIKQSELFKDLNDAEALQVAALVTHKTVLKNTMVISEGDNSTSMYLIKKGKVNVVLASNQGKEMILSTLLPGDHFGELSLLDTEPRSANIIAQEKCEFILLDRVDFFKLIESHPSIAIEIIRYLCQRVRFISNIAQGFALLDVYGRLVNLLTSLAEKNEQGLLVVSLPLTHKEIGLRVGAARETISRMLSELERGGYLSVAHKTITINKKLPIAW